MRYLLGADIGTTRTKCILFDETGRAVASALRDYPCHRDSGNRSEQEARDWWKALVECVREVLAAAGDARNLLAMCVATQGGTLVPVDEYGEPLRRAIVWNDGRCAKEREILAARCTPDYVWRKSGWRLGNGLNALQILWLRENEPETFRRAWKFLSVPDYIAFKLTGRCKIDPSNAGINQLADISRNAWDEDILSALGIGEDRLSGIVESGDVIGRLTPDAARELGLEQGTLLIAGGHDQYLCALGAGAVQDGDIFLATGTCWVVAAISERRPERFSVSRCVLPGLWGALQSQETGGEALEWLRQQVLPPEHNDYAWINDSVSKVSVGSNGVTFYPLLTGASHPIISDAVRGAFIGISSGTSRQDMARAVMEGVCFQALWMMESFGLANMQAIRMTGGAAHSAAWVQMMADIAGLPVSVPALADAGCVGAAILAGITSGVFASAADGIAAMNQGGRVVQPGENARAYRALYGRYKRNFEYLVKMYD